MNAPRSPPAPPVKLSPSTSWRSTGRATGAQSEPAATETAPSAAGFPASTRIRRSLDEPKLRRHQRELPPDTAVVVSTIDPPGEHSVELPLAVAAPKERGACKTSSMKTPMRVVVRPAQA